MKWYQRHICMGMRLVLRWISSSRCMSSCVSFWDECHATWLHDDIMIVLHSCVIFLYLHNILASFDDIPTSCHHVAKDVGMSSKEANILCKYRNRTQECKIISDIFMHVHASLLEMYATICSDVKRDVGMSSKEANVVKRDQSTGWRGLIGPVSCRSFSTKEPLNIGHFCGKWPIKISDPMGLRRPVSWQRFLPDLCRSFDIILFHTQNTFMYIWRGYD